MQPQIQPQAQPTAPAQGMSMAPQPQAQHQAATESGRAGQNYDPNLLPIIEKHLNTLPDQQKAYLVQYLTPELAVLFGIVIGNEAYDYFSKFVDKGKMLTVVPRQQEQNSAPQPAPQEQQAQQPVQGAGAQAPQSQPKATAPSIMGV